MKDTELYRLYAGLPEPWTVDRIMVDEMERRVDIWASHPNGVLWTCPGCGHAGPSRDHAAERTWRHLDCCQFETHLHARIPRVACPQHGVRQVLVPWAEPDSRFTRLFEKWAIELLQTCPVSGTAAILAITWDEARGIRHRALRRGETVNGMEGINSINGHQPHSAKPFVRNRRSYAPSPVQQTRTRRVAVG
jgi:transposase